MSAPTLPRRITRLRSEPPARHVGAQGPCTTKAKPPAGRAHGRGTAGHGVAVRWRLGETNRGGGNVRGRMTRIGATATGRAQPGGAGGSRGAAGAPSGKHGASDANTNGPFPWQCRTNRPAAQVGPSGSRAGLPSARQHLFGWSRSRGADHPRGSDSARRASAHPAFSAGVKQQQLRSHWAADMHPHGRS